MALNEIRDRLPVTPAAPDELSTVQMVRSGELTGHAVPAAPAVVYPRFLGVDESGDFAWELASGRWTWGEDPYDASRQERTFTPESYLDKYGPVRPLPVSDVLGHTPVDGPAPDPDTQAGRILALAAMERVAKNWAVDAAKNEEAMDRRDRLPSDKQPFVLADILRMIDDAAREVGVAPVYGGGK